MTPPVLTEMWVIESGPAYHEGNTAGCTPVPVEGRTLPKGLRGLATPARSECGPDWTFMRFEVPAYPHDRLQAFYVPTHALASKPPPDAWAKAASAATVYTWQAGEKPTLGLPLDNPSWTAPALLPGGEPVERLAPDVIRTASGHELWVDPFYLGEVTPLGRKDYSASEASVPLRQRFVSGLARAEKSTPLTALPSAAALTKLPAGAAFWFVLKPEWLDEGRFVPEWFDPVGQTLEHACAKEPRPGEPCGSYTLDYTAFGAWLPIAEVDVVGVWSGKQLAVQVIEPWSDHIAVSPAWEPAPK